jgi:hypothetical protein
MTSNRYLLLIVFVLSFGKASLGQVIQQPDAVKKITIPKEENDKPLQYNKTSALTAAPIWSDDFSVPSNWVINNGSTSGDNWIIGTTKPQITLGKIKSTTASNGFALFDSDKLCSGNQVAFLSTAKPIDLSAHPNVKLIFQQNYGKFKDSTFISISTDGTNWLYYRVNGDYNDNDFSLNPDMASLDISNTAGGKKTVWLRFAFISRGKAAGAGCAYSWQVDDVSLIDIPQNDMAINKAFVEMGPSLFYSQIPKSQIDTVRFLGLLSNNGASYQTKVKLNVTIQNGATQVYNTDSYVLDTVRPGERDTIAIFKKYFLPPAVSNKTYTIKLKAVQNEVDADSTNNTLVKSFAITDSVYARDKGDLVNSSYTSPNFYKGGDMDNSSMGVLYSMPANSAATSVSVFLDSLTSLNTSISAYIYELVKADSIVPFVLKASSDFYVITKNADKGKWVTLALKKSPGQVLLANKLYLASITTTDVTASTQTSTGLVPGHSVVFKSDITSQQRGYVTWIYLANSSQARKWFVVKDSPFIRLNINKNAVGIEENEALKTGIDLHQNTPNPFNRITTVSYTLGAGSDVVLEISDIAGRKLITLQQGVLSAGRHSIQINTGELSQGIYFYTLKTNGQSISKRMVVVE